MNLSLSIYIYIYIYIYIDVYCHCLVLGRVRTEVTSGRGDLRVCPLEGLIGAQESLVSNRRGGPHRDKH